MHSSITISRLNFAFQPFHLVDISPWPLLTSFALLSITLSATIWMHGIQHASYLLQLSFLGVLGAMILWFRDVVAEGTLGGHHTFKVQNGLNLGVAIFIVSEIFFFISIFWAFFHSALAPTVELGSSWPPAGLIALNPFAVPLLNTVLLLSSGACITYAHHSLIIGMRKSVLSGILLTLILALIFTFLQAIEYVEAPFTISDSVFGSSFFFGTGFHGIHVIIGTAFIAVAFARIVLYHFTKHHHLGYESSILYWHFVDIVWLFLYSVIYWWGS